MENIKNIVISVVVAALVSVAAISTTGVSDQHIAAVASQAVAQAVESVGGAGGGVYNTIAQWTAGLMPGDQNIFYKSGTIEAGQNQASWRNMTGRTVYVRMPELGWTSGTASSSLRFFVATSSAATLTSDYTVPSGILPLTSGIIATGTRATLGPIIVAGTTTPSGLNGSIAVLDRAYLNFQVQTVNGPACDGSACETASSTNRGITRFIWTFLGRYQP